MASCSTKLTMRELEARVSYPARKKRVDRSSPVRSAESKRLLEEYRASVAMQTRERSRFHIATTNVNGTIRSASATAEGLFRDAEAAELKGHLEESLSCLLEILRLDKESPTEANLALINVRIGIIFMTKRMMQEALEYLDAAVRIDPLDSSNYLLRAECYLELENRLEDALTEFEKYFKLESPGKQLLVRCGKTALDCEQHEKAEHYLRAVFNVEDPGGADDASSDAYAYYNLGELNEKLGNDELARECYAKVTISDPNFPQPYLAQAGDLMGEGNYQFALHLYEAVAKMLPHDPQVYVHVADVYEKLGEEFSSSVLTCLTKALELSQDKEFRESMFVRRGWLLFQQFGDVEQALADLTLCLETCPRQAEALERRAICFRHRDEEGDAAAAVADYRILVSIPTVSWKVRAEPHRYLASTAFTKNEYEEAAKLYALAIVAGAELTEEDQAAMICAAAHGMTDNGAETFEVAYESRGWGVAKHAASGAGAKKANAQSQAALDPAVLRGIAVPGVRYQVADAYYRALRNREPTMHSAIEYDIIKTMKPYREEAERRREEADALRTGKKPAKRK